MLIRGMDIRSRCHDMTECHDVRIGMPQASRDDGPLDMAFFQMESHGEYASDHHLDHGSHDAMSVIITV
jgi:hypothetical protein